MITPFFRSSLLNCFELCPLRCFIEYSVGLRGEANLSALVGSTVHGVMEILALYKLAYQNNQFTFSHDSFGEFTLDDIDEKWNEEVVREFLLDISYDYYNKESPGIFTEDSYKECLKLVNQALSFQNGSFDPRNSNIYAAELPFELEINDDWAFYEYEDDKGNIINGQLALKGTIDLVCIEDENT